MKVSAMFQLIYMRTVFTFTAPGVLMVLEHQYLLWVAEILHQSKYTI